MSAPIQNRYDFVLLFDVRDGNPNGDPDAGNLPRIDPETGNGLVTDVCLKRKVRNYVGIARDYQRPFDIYIKEKAVLGRAHTEAFKALDIELGEVVRREIPEDLHETFEELTLPDGLEKGVGDNDTPQLVINPGIDKKIIKDWLKEDNPGKPVEKFIEEDLALFWEALLGMFEHDHSAARGQMATRGLYVFKHDGKLGNAPAHELFDRIAVNLNEGVAIPRGFDHYTVTAHRDSLPAGVTLLSDSELLNPASRYDQ